MIDSQNYLIEHEKIRTDQFRKRFNYFLNNLNEKISELDKSKHIFVKSHQNIQAQVNNHYENIVNHTILEKKNYTEKEVNLEYSRLSQKFEQAIEQANQLKLTIDSEIDTFEKLVDRLNNDTSSKSDLNEDFSEEDALMINDTGMEFTQDPKPSKNEILSRLEDVFSKIESLMNEGLLIDAILNDLSSGILNENTIKLVKCMPDLSGVCFAHLRKELPDKISQESFHKMSTISPCDLLDHTHFKMETHLSENFTFKKSQKCFITFSCSDLSKQKENGETNLHDNLLIELYDSNQNSVPFDLKEKFTNSLRFIRIYFLPQSAGIFKLSIKFKNKHINNSPFHFVVLTEQVTPSVSSTNVSCSSSYTSITNESQPQVFKTPQAPAVPEIQVLNLSPTNTLNTVDFNQALPPLAVGRGRLIKMRNAANSATSTPSPVIPSVSQKRKSPSHIHDSNNNNLINEEFMDAEDEMSVREISNKLKKVVCVDESINKYHNYSMQSISSVMSLNVNTNSSNYNPKQSLQAENPACIVSNHLRKYSSSNGLVRPLTDGNIPPLKAVFQRKYANCNFPIGVRSCKIRNWVIVCDNGNNSVKIFERSSGELLHEIKDNPSQEYTFRRPSAVILNENDSEIYVKDDKEILVFNLEQNFRLMRKFGFKILRKPYGLAYDSNENLVVVDADLRNPLIHTFNRHSGKLLNSKPYQPALKNFAQSSSLIRQFGDQNIIGNLVPYEKTKIRFISSNGNSLYAADLGRSIVYRTNLDGEVELAFGFQGKRRGELNEPSGVHVDSDGSSVLVGDSKNNRIQVYGSDGKYKCEIEFLEDKVIRPSDIYVDSEGYLYVSCFIQHCVKKFKLESE